MAPFNKEQMELNTIEEFKRLLWKCVSSIERVENLLTNNDMNNNNGLVATVQDHATKLGELESFKKLYEYERVERDKRNNRNMVVMALVFTAVQIALSFKK